MQVFFSVFLEGAEGEGKERGQAKQKRMMPFATVCFFFGFVNSSKKNNCETEMQAQIIQKFYLRFEERETFA